MNIQMLVFTDGRRECIERTMASFREHLIGEHGVTIINDCPDLGYATFLRQKFADGTTSIIHHHIRQGFGGAIRSGWASLPPKTDYVFHLEDDFELVEDIELSTLVDILVERPDVVQVALKRQPWNHEEREAGGIVELHSSDFLEEQTSMGPITTHRRFFTTNPSLYRASLTQASWPQVDHSEGIFTHQLLYRDMNTRFAFLGGKFDPPKVIHIGHERVGTGY